MTKADLLSLLKHETTVAELAAARGVSEAEVLAARDAFLLGVEARPATSRPSTAVVALLVALVVGVIVTRASAAGTCAQTLTSPLNTLCPDEPAYASELNDNFGQVTRWMVEKTGPMGDGGIVTPALRVNGPLTATGATSTGGLTVNGNLRVTGTSLGSYTTLSGSTDYVATTDGFVVVSLTGDSNGSRCFAHGIVDTVIRARESLHYFTNSDVFVNDASFMMPVARNSTWRVNKTDTALTCTMVISWVPLHP
jgi:hypothetical protein